MDNKDAKKKALLKVVAFMGKISSDKIKDSKKKKKCDEKEPVEGE